MPLRYSRYFDTITMWTFTKEGGRRKNNFAFTRLRTEIEGLLNNSGNIMHVKIMLPTESEPLIG
jgi:hypothetical protein